jgi:putrescine aminotransferase
VRPDIVVTAKAITSGYVPFGAVLIGDRPMELLEGCVLRHGLTYNAHPVGAAVALENLDIIEREHLLDRVRDAGDHLAARLGELAASERVIEVRGEGLMWGIDFDGIDGQALSVRLRERGVIVRGVQNRIVISPPFVIETDEIEQLADRLIATVSDF